MATPLLGLVVLDLSSGPAAGLATMILSDFGASVSRFPDPDFLELNEGTATKMWLRGKDTAHEPLHEAIAKADVLVITRPNGFSSADFETATRINSRLIYAEVVGIAEHPSLPVSEPVVAAKLGRMKSLSGILEHQTPHFSSVKVATHATAQNLVTGILAALYERRSSGVGQKITTSLAHGLIPYDQGASLGMQIRERTNEPAPTINPSEVMPTLNYHPVQCADGRWLQLGNLLPHLFANFMNAIGLGEEVELLHTDPTRLEATRDKILLTMQTKTCAEWMTLFVQDGGIAAHPYQTRSEALEDPDMVENGHVVELAGVNQLGPVARLTRTPANITEHGKAADETAPFDARSKAQLVVQSSDQSDIPPSTSPLRGVVVLELATIIAAPLGASFLADLGARVIKVESIGGDPYRKMAGGFGAIRCNQGKESIGLDLKSPDGQAIASKLIGQADILIHNFRPGVPERLGFGYEQVRQIKPDLIYLSANGYGAGGPGALRPSTHPIPGAAIGGALHQAGGAPASLLDIESLRESARRLMRANEVNPDPNTALVIATSALLGLLAQDSKGQQVFGDMFIANAYANFEHDMAPLDDHLLGVGPLERLYPCKSGWVFLSIVRDRDFETFCELLGQQHLTDHYPNPRETPNESLETELAKLFAGDTAHHFESLLLPHGVGCVVADDFNLAEFFKSECTLHSNYMVETAHPDLGNYFRHKPMLQFSRSRLNARGGVKGGQHTGDLMSELGFSEKEIEDLHTKGILWTA